MTEPSNKSENTLEMSDLLGASALPEVDSAMTNLEPDHDHPNAPNPGQAVHPTESVEPPVFRNPLAASLATVPADFGAALTPVAPAPKAPAIRLNLSPSFDSFSAHGLSLTTNTSPTATLLTKLSQWLHLSKIFSSHNLRYAGVGIVSFAIFLFVFNFQTLTSQIGYWISPPKPQAPVATQLPAATVASSGSQAEVAPAGDVLFIPKLNLANVPVIFEPSISEDAIQKSLQRGIVHYAGTALPGEKSNIVIVGHSSNDWWEPGSYKFVFALLDKMTAGDQIQINYQQKKYVYEVTGTKIVEPTEISVLQPTTSPQLTLITCTPPGTSWKRLVVIAKQISPLPDAPTKTAASTSVAPSEQLALPGNATGFFDQVKRWLGFGKPAASTTTPVTQPSQAPVDPTRNHLPASV